MAALSPWRDRLRALDAIDSELVIGAAGGALLALGLGFGQPVLVGAGAVGTAMVCRNLINRRLAPPAGALHEPKAGRTTTPGGAPEQHPPQQPPARRAPRSLNNEGDLVEEMLLTGRYALLLRPETAGQLTREQHQAAVQALDDHMVLTPAGPVLLGSAAERETLGHDAAAGLVESGAEGVGMVATCYLDRCPITNAQYQEFVDAGGYDAMEFWPEEALPAIFDFIDETGVGAPRFWRDGRYAEGEGQLPVVGVSWHEAVAYAQWVGKRLPTDAEWTKACAWPIESTPGRVAQRRYPWGEAFDTRRANLWSAGQGRPVEVEQYPQGASVGGALQMVGNVWEWTASTLDETTPQAVRFPSALRTIRGGAFNTYFENQATCHFQSADHPLVRKDNIGIRLAISMDVLASAATTATAFH